MNHLLWLTVMASLLVANAVVEDESDVHFLDLVRKKAQTDNNMSEDRKIDDNVEEQDASSTSKRTSMNMAERNQPMQAQEVGLRESKRGDMKNDLYSRLPCKTLSCRLQYAFESVKDGNQLELGGNKDKRGEDAPKKRCVAWQCRRSLVKTREKALFKKSQGAKVKRCLAWGCKRRSLQASKRDSTATQDNDEMKKEDIKRQEHKEEKLQTTNVKKRVPKKCIAWTCGNKEGKRTVPAKRSGEVDDYKKIVSRKPDDLLGLFGSSRDGRCRGLQCLRKRTRDATVLSRKNEMPSGCVTWDCYGKRAAAKKEPGEKIDAFKRIISRNPYNDMLGLTGEKCKGSDCYGKRATAEKEPGEKIDAFKRIISRRNHNSMLGLAEEKCRDWKCIMKHVFHELQNDKPIKCLSWDCDKRRADTGESTETQENTNAESNEKDASQYGIPDEYKDRRDALRRVSPYAIDRGSRSTQKQDI